MPGRQRDNTQYNTAEGRYTNVDGRTTLVCARGLSSRWGICIIVRKLQETSRSNIWRTAATVQLASVHMQDPMQGYVRERATETKRAIQN